MAMIGNLVQETSTSTGTGDFTLSASIGKQRFSDELGTGAGNPLYYFISHQTANEWEVGSGYMSDANTLVRSTVIESSNANSLVSFSAGTKDVVNDLPASKQAFGGDPNIDWDGSTLTVLGNEVIGSNAAGRNLNLYATLGSELAPAFTAVNWTAVNWSFSGGSAIHVAGSVGNIIPVIAITPTIGHKYKVVLVVSSGAAEYTQLDFGGNTLIIGGVGTYEVFMTASTTAFLYIFNQTTGGSVTLSSLSVKRVLTGGEVISEGIIEAKGGIAVSSMGIGKGLTTPLAPLEIVDVGSKALRISRAANTTQYIEIHQLNGSQHTISAIGDKSLWIGSNAPNFGIQLVPGNGTVSITQNPSGVGGQLNLARLRATASGATEVPAIFQGAASQTGNLIQCQTSAGTIVSTFNNKGDLRVRTDATNGGLHIGTTAADGTYKGIWVGDATSNLNFENYSFLGVDNGTTRQTFFNVTGSTGSMCFRQNNNTHFAIANSRLMVTTVGNPTGSEGDALARLSVMTDAASSKGIVIRGHATQTANYFECQNSAGTAQASISNTGLIRSITDISAYFGSYDVRLTALGGTVPALSLQGDVNISRSAAGILQIGTTAANSSGSLLLNNLTASKITIPYTATGTERYVNSAFANFGREFGMYVEASGNEGGFKANSVFTLKAANITLSFISPVTLCNFVSTSTSSVRWNNIANTAIDLSGANSTGLVSLLTNTGGLFAALACGSITAISPSATTIGLIARGAASQTANLQEWQNSAGTVLSSIKATGVLNLPAFTVATLPTGVQGDRCYVTDASAPTFLTALTGGGAVRCSAFHNGTTWVAG